MKPSISLRTHAGRIGHDVVALGEVHGTAVECADFGQDLRDLREPLIGARHVGLRGVERQRLLRAAQHEVAAHASGEIEHDVDAGFAHTLDDLATERRIARGGAGPRVADLDVRDRGAGLGGLYRRGGDLLRRDRNVLALSVVAPASVTAQVMKTFRFMAFPRQRSCTSSISSIRSPTRCAGLSAVPGSCGT